MTEWCFGVFFSLFFSAISTVWMTGVFTKALGTFASSEFSFLPSFWSIAGQNMGTCGLLILFLFDANGIWYILRLYGTSMGREGTFARQWLEEVKGRVKSAEGSVSSVNFIKRSRVSEAAVPDLIDNLLCMSLISASRPCSHGQDGPSPDALLVLLGKLPLTSSEELARPSALAAE
jgi:hypothetical protein